MGLVDRAIYSIKGFLSGLPVASRVALLIAVAGPIASLGFLDVYSQNDPGFCRSCHVMIDAWDRWNASEHRKVGCLQCHELGFSDTLNQIKVYFLNRPDQISVHAEVPDYMCGRCHMSGNPQWEQIASTAGHQVHNQREYIGCTRCHSTSIHVFRPPDELCGECHAAQAAGDRVIKIAAMQKLSCTECHPYLKEESSIKPGPESCLRCHSHFRDFTWKSEGPMSFACRNCHKPHIQAAPIANCTTCHSVLKDLTGIHLKAAHQEVNCVKCHVAHTWDVNYKACENCHPVYQ